MARTAEHSPASASAEKRSGRFTDRIATEAVKRATATVLGLTGIVGGVGITTACESASATPDTTSPSVEQTIAPTETAAPSPVVTPEVTPSAEATISPEAQAKIDTLEALVGDSFESASVEDKLFWQSYALRNVDAPDLLSRWAKWSGQDYAADYAEPSATNTAQQAINSASVSFLSAFLKDSGAWDSPVWNEDRARKILSSQLDKGFAQGYISGLDAYEKDGEFYELLQLAAIGSHTIAEVQESTPYIDSNNHNCYAITTKPSESLEGAKFDLCLYSYTDIYGNETSAWVRTNN